jgi:hypothetical protein
MANRGWESLYVQWDNKIKLGSGAQSAHSALRHMRCARGKRIRAYSALVFGVRVDLLSRLFPNLGVGRHPLRLHDGHDCIGGVGEEFTVALEFVGQPAGWTFTARWPNSFESSATQPGCEGRIGSLVRRSQWLRRDRGRQESWRTIRETRLRVEFVVIFGCKLRILSSIGHIATHTIRKAQS